MTGLSRRNARMTAAGAFVLSMAADIGSKWVMHHVVMTPPRTIEVTTFFNLVLGYNPGISFGMFKVFFAEYPLMLIGIKAAIIGGVVLWAMKTRNGLEAAALGMIAGGATGNLVDRVFRGAVTDFLDFHLGHWRWPTFNIADAAITLGVLLMIISATRAASRSS